MKKILSILMLLVAIVTGAWAQDPTHANPATVTVANRTFLDLQNTPHNVEVSTDYYSNYGPGYFITHKNDDLTNSWWSFTGTFKSTSNSYKIVSGAVGFHAPGSSSSSEFYQILQMRTDNNRMNGMDFYVKGTTQIGFQWKNAGTSGKYLTFTIYEMDVTGSTATDIATPVSTVQGSTTSDSDQYAASSTLDGSKYYHIVVTPLNTSNINFYGLTFKHAPSAPVAKHKVEYNLGDATGGTAPTQADVAEGVKFNVAAAPTDLVAPTGKEFKCWNDGTTDYAPGDEYTMGTSDVTLTAQYQNETVKYSVEYKLNGGSGDAPTQESLAEGSVFTVASAEGITAPEGKRFSTWNDGTNDYAPGADYTMGTSNVTLTAQWENIYAITSLDGIEHGSVSADKATAAEGETVTLTATPDFKYVLSAWNVYKTGEPETTVTVTDNKFTMPAYAVTVAATFESDSRKQVLYVTADGNVNSSDDLYAALSEDYGVTVAKYDASKTVTDFDLVVLHESIDGGKYYNTGLVKTAKTADVPLLNTKSYFYTAGSSARWGWGTPDNGKGVTGCNLGTSYLNVASHPIFNGVTITNGFIEVVGAAVDSKSMQPVASFETGYEGYTLATSPLKSSDNTGTAIHELTPAQRGVTSAKYLLISVSNACLNDLTANGKKLFKNAAAYLMGTTAWTPEVSKEVTLNDGGDKFTKGFTTFCSSANFTVSEGATAYKAAIADSKLTMTALEGIIPANTGVVIAGSKNANVTITATTADATADVEGNDLKGTTAAALTADLKGTAAKFLAFRKTTSTFTPYGGENFPANKAYILLDGENAPLSLDMVFDEATGINNVNAAETEAQAAPVKVIKNGKLYIGNYNVAGQQVK